MTVHRPAQTHGPRTRPLQSTTSAGASTRADPRNACRGFVKQPLLDRWHADPDAQAEARHRTHPQESIKNHGRYSSDAVACLPGCSSNHRCYSRQTIRLRQFKLSSLPRSLMLFPQDTAVPVYQLAQQPCRWVISAPTFTFDVPIGTGCNQHFDPAALPLNRPSGLLLRWDEPAINERARHAAECHAMRAEPLHRLPQRSP